MSFVPPGHAPSESVALPFARRSMADSTSVAAEAASIPAPADIERAERFTREPFVHAGEEPAAALAPGMPRRAAFDVALQELAEGAEVPSTKWRRRFSLLLGLERVLSEEEPRLADGTSLNPHQVDALSGTLTALLAETQGKIKPAAEAGAANGSAPAPVLAVDDDDQDVVAHPGADEEAAAEVEALDEEFDEEFAQDAQADAADDADEAFEEDPEAPDETDEDVEPGEGVDDPNAAKRFWFEHATGAGKTVAAMGFVEASRTGGVLILTHRRNLVDQFLGELADRGYAERESPALLDGEGTGRTDGPVTVETYQWFVRNAGRISDAYTIVICDEAHTALGEKTSAAIRAWTGPIFVGMTATGALIARHVTDLFPTQTSRFDLAQAARRGVIAPLRCIRIPPGPGVRTIAKVPLRRGDVDVEFDQELLAELLDQLPFNMAVADLYKTRFNGVPGVVYAAGVRHAYNVADAFRELGMKAEAVSGETPKRELAAILARYEGGEIDVLVNAQLLAEGWNSPRATICMHLAPTASKRIYQQRVGRVTRRHPGKESGIVVDFVHPATRHDDPVVTLHSLLDRDVYRGGAIVVGPVRRGRGRRLRVERRVVPVCAAEDRRHDVFERELWRVAVELLDPEEQHMWAALAGARVSPSGWRRARAMLHFDASGELRRRFLTTAVERNRNAQLRIRALQEIAASRDGDAFDHAVDVIGTWAREERREGAKIMFQALAEKRIGRRDQANAWIWRMAEGTRDIHEEYAVQRWPETKRLLGLLVNSSGGAHARNARRLVQASRKQDRRLSAALLAAAVAHTPEAEEVLRGARTRMARKPSALSRELLRNFPKGKRARGSRRRRGKGGDPDAVAVEETVLAPASNGAGAQAPEKVSDEEATTAIAAAAELLGVSGIGASGAEPDDDVQDDEAGADDDVQDDKAGADDDDAGAGSPEPGSDAGDEPGVPAKPRLRRVRVDDEPTADELAVAAGAISQAEITRAEKARAPRRRRRTTKPAGADAQGKPAGDDAGDKPKPKSRSNRRRRRSAKAKPATDGANGSQPSGADGAASASDAPEAA
jgi:ribonuclease E